MPFRTRQRRRLAAFELFEQVLRAAGAPAVEFEQLLLLAGEREHVLERLHVARGDQLLHLLRSEPFDVERAAAGEVHDATDQLVLAVERAAVEELAVEVQLATATRAVRRWRGRHRIGRTALGEHAHHLGDHVAGALDLDLVADPHVAFGEQAPIVQRRVAHRHAGEFGEFNCATGVTAPVRPTCAPIASTRVVASRGANL